MLAPSGAEGDGVLMIKLLIRLLFPKVYEEIGREFMRKEAIETERHFARTRPLYVREKKVN